MIFLKNQGVGHFQSPKTPLKDPGMAPKCPTSAIGPTSIEVLQFLHHLFRPLLLNVLGAEINQAGGKAGDHK
jgi:hypothetical protein